MEDGNQSFTITRELSLSSDIKIASWCPTMDLCAVVSTDGQLRLHRMDWQQLWAVAPEALITAICWRPDGKELAAGHVNGALSMLDVETGDTTAAHKVHYAAIATISWADQADSISTHSRKISSSGNPVSCGLHHSMMPHQRYKRLFAPPILEPYPPSSTEPPPHPYDFCIEAVGAPAWPQDRAGLSLLTVADVRGVITLWLQGQVQIAEIAGNAISSSVSHPADDHTADDQDHSQYKLLHVMPSSQLDQLLTVHSSPTGSVLMVAHSLQLIKQQQQPLQQCTALFSQLQSFLKAAVKCVEVCAQDWSSVMRDFRKQFDTQLKQELADQGSSITVPQQELLLLLATSCTTPPMQSFLASTLGEANLRRLARAVDTTASGLHTALLERVMPLVELVVFLLGELRGLVSCRAGSAGTAAGSWLGLQVELLQQLELNAAALLLRTEHLRRAVTTLACQYRAFFTWLLTTIKQLEGQDPSQEDSSNGISTNSSMPLASCQDVLVFLKGQFLDDLIGPELEGSNLSPDAQSRAEAFFYQGISPAETHRLLSLLLPRSLNTEALGPGLAAIAKTQTSDAVAYPYLLPNSPVTAAVQSPERQQKLQSQQQQQQQQREEVVSEEQVQKAAAACSRPLAQQLKHLATLCEEVFEQPISVISPSIRPVQQLLLTPAASSSSSSTEPSVAVAPPLLQPKSCVDHQMCVCCSASAAAGDVEQQQHLLVARFPPEAFQQQQQQQQEEEDGQGPKGVIAAEAVLLQLPSGWTAAAWEFYQQQQLALLLSAGDGTSVLHLLQLKDAPWTPVQPSLLQQQQQQQQQPLVSPPFSVRQHCLQHQAAVAVEDLPRRSRQLQHSVSDHQLSVSRSRGLASLVTDMQRLLLLDLEEDEGADDGQDEEDAEADNMSEE